MIVVIQVGAMKTYLVIMEALKKNERQDEIQIFTKIDGILNFTPN